MQREGNRSDRVKKQLNKQQKEQGVGGAILSLSLKKRAENTLEKPKLIEKAVEAEANSEQHFEELFELLQQKFKEIKFIIEEIKVDYPDEIQLQITTLLDLFKDYSNKKEEVKKVSTTYNVLIKSNIDLPINSVMNRERYTYFVKNLRKVKHDVNQKLLAVSEIQSLINEHQDTKQDLFSFHPIKNLKTFSNKLKKDLDLASKRLSESETNSYSIGYSVDIPEPATLIQNNSIDYSVISVGLVNGQREDKWQLIDLKTGADAEKSIMEDMSEIEGVLMSIGFPSHTRLDSVLKVDGMVICSDQVVEASKIEEMANMILTISNYFYAESVMDDNPELKNAYQKKRQKKAQKDQKKGIYPKKITEDKDYKNTLEAKNNLEKIQEELGKKNAELQRILKIDIRKSGKQKKGKPTEINKKIDYTRTSIEGNQQIILDLNKEILKLHQKIKKIEAIEQGIDPQDIALSNSLSPYLSETIIYQNGKSLEIDQKEGIDQMIKLIENEKQNQVTGQFITGVIRDFNKLIIELNARCVPIQAKNSLHSGNRESNKAKIANYQQTQENIAGLVALNDNLGDRESRLVEYTKFLAL